MKLAAHTVLGNIQEKERKGKKESGVMGVLSYSIECNFMRVSALHIYFTVNVNVNDVLLTGQLR